ncbi:MAG: hypothetical protein ACTSUD_06055 [Alphaproteobacteria bacterium]
MDRVRRRLGGIAPKRLAWLFVSAPLAVAGAGALAQRADDCAVLARLAGNWSGRGTLQRKAGAEPEAVRCRLKIDWRGPSRVMSSEMDCRGIDLDFKLWGSIGARGPQGKLKGAYFGSEGLVNVTASGHCRPLSLELSLKEVKPKPGAPVSSTLTIALSEDGAALKNLLDVLDPDTGARWRSISISFKR